MREVERDLRRAEAEIQREPHAVPTADSDIGAPLLVPPVALPAPPPPEEAVALPPSAAPAPDMSRLLCFD